VQLKREKLLELSNFLEMNQEVIRLMNAGFRKFQRKRNLSQGTNSNSGEADFEQMATEDFMASLDEQLMRTSNHQKRVLNLIRRCDGLIGSVSRVLVIVYTDTHSMKVPSMLASRENCIMRDIQVEATQYSRSMRAMTIVALAYLPATLASVCPSHPKL